MCNCSACCACQVPGCAHPAATLPRGQPNRLPHAMHRLPAGLVERPCQLSMAELTERFEEHAVLSTLSCAGNRSGHALTA